MTANVSTMSFKPTGTTNSSTLGDFTAGAYLDPVNFGADPTGVIDSTAEVQACFDAAFGSFTSPHAANSNLNKPVFLSGGFKVSSPGSATVTACASGTGGVVRLTLSAPLVAAFVESSPVLVTGVNDECDGPGLIHIVDSTHVEILNTVFSSSTVTGPTSVMNLPCLRIRALQGGKIFGKGRFTSALYSASTNCAVIATNGCNFSSFSDFFINSGNGSVGFDLNWMGGVSETVSLQSVTFTGMWITWTGFGNLPNLGLYGIAIGGHGNQGDTIIVQDCFIGGYLGGVVPLNPNAAQIQVIGGNFASNDYGVYGLNGTFSNITGVNFQQSQLADINLNYGAGECCTISGCRDENGAGFLITAHPILGVNVDNCSYLAGSGFFHSGHGHVTITSSTITGGFDEGGVLVVQCCAMPPFGSPIDKSLFTAGTQRFRQLNVIPQIVTPITSGTYTVVGADSSSLLSFSSTGAQVVTLPRTHGNGTHLEEGVKIDVQQLGAGAVSFTAGASVTLSALTSGGSPQLRMAGQYAKASLMVVATDTWVFSGQIMV
jgi:hypothetical protein